MATEHDGGSARLDGTRKVMRDEEDEQVVDRQRLLRHVAGEVLAMPT
jgi:hypothetical protein